MNKLTLSYSEEDKRNLKKAAQIALNNGAPVKDPRRGGVSKSAFVRWLVGNYLKEQDSEKPVDYLNEAVLWINNEQNRQSRVPMRDKDWEWILSRIEYAIELLDK